MTLRDVHDRCVTCGRPPSEACCPDCHVNTEAINQ